MARGPPGKTTDSWNQGHKVAREMAAVLGHRADVEGFLGVERVARGTGWGGACRVHNDGLLGRGQGAAPWENPCVTLCAHLSEKKPSTVEVARGGKVSGTRL